MAKTPKKVSSLYVKEQNKDYLKPEYLEATSDVVGAGQFYSEITNRAPLIDPSQDLGVRFGVNRIQTQQLYRIQDEVGPNDEPVYGLVNDRFGQIRLIGNEWFDSNDENGTIIRDTSSFDDFLEITFYGTGLNWLAFLQSGTTRNFDISVDGAPTNTVSIVGSPVLQSRNYTVNQVINLVSGLTLGVHTVKISQDLANDFGGLFFFSGFEILNERTDLLIPKGSYFNDGKLLRLTSEQNTAFDSGFTNEYGTPGTKGGCVSVYLTENGLIKKDIQWTDVTALYLANTDHSNEEIISNHNFREFGAGRGDDFSTLTSTSDRAFTLSDGTTTLLCDDCSSQNEALVHSTVGDFFTITFVGTGLDILRRDNNDVVSSQDNRVYIDGVDVGSAGSDGSTQERIEKICSGLPYGTHTVKIQMADTAAYSYGARSFIIYGPKKPEIEDSSVELSSYYLMADFAANATQSAETISNGVIRKASNREMFFSGTWSQSTIDVTSIGGLEIQTTTPASYVEYTFFGTGFDFRWNDGNFTLQFTLDGSTDFSGFTTSHYTNSTATFTPATGAMTAGDATGLNQGLVVSGLTLGVHTIRVAMPSTGGQAFRPFAFDVITPLHFPKNNGPFVIQNNLRIGSQSVGDSRELADENSKAMVIARGITSSPTTTSTTYIPTPDMNATVHTSGNPIEINFEDTPQNAGAFNSYYKVIVDGKDVIERTVYNSFSGEQLISIKIVVPVGAGTHNVNIARRTSGGTMNSSGTYRTLIVKEL